MRKQICFLFLYGGNMNYYNEIRERLVNNEIYERVKDYSKERNRVNTYYEVGKLLNDAGKHYGENIIDKYAEKLTLDVGKKYNRATLYKMRQLYILFESEKVAPEVRQLSWTHCLSLLSIKNIDKINYYINRVVNNNLSKRELQEIIKNNEYERLPEEAKDKLIDRNNNKIQDFIKNPIIIHNPNNIEVVKEKILHNLILEDIEVFLKELGEGFSFISSEYKIKLGDRYNYIDILLFNYIYNCFVVIELKVTELRKEHIGQIEVYMNYIDNNLKNINQDKTIGIIICKKNNKYILAYTSDKRIISKEYMLI